MNLFGRLNENAGIAFKAAEWGGVCVLNGRCLCADGANFFPQMKPNG